MLLTNIKNRSNVALVINWKFHKNNKWVSIFAPHLVKAIIKEFDPIIVNSQLEYNIFKRKIKYIISMEPGWAAPKIKYDTELNQFILVLASDPHNKTGWFQEYILENNINFVLSQYCSPFFYHFPSFPKEKFIHFPWAIPDEFISTHTIQVRDSNVVIFGGKKSDAYDVRNWCRQQDGIINFDNSGVENKKFSDMDYFKFLSSFDAIVSAGSSNPKYDLVTPKYFEIASAGALLIGQKCKDLNLLGFNESNMLLFTKDTFKDVVASYKQDPASFIQIRKNGRELIKARHLISHRINLIKKLLNL